MREVPALDDSRRGSGGNNSSVVCDKFDAGQMINVAAASKGDPMRLAGSMLLRYLLQDLPDNVCALQFGSSASDASRSMRRGVSSEVVSDLLDCFRPRIVPAFSLVRPFWGVILASG